MLNEVIETLCQPYSLKELQKGAQELSKLYEEGKAHKTPLHQVAYLVMRMPATCAVLSKVLDFEGFQSVVDCGAGPGTSFFALQHHSVQSLTLIEQDREFIRLGKKLLFSSSLDVEWKAEPFYTFKERGDLILFSYSLNEIDPSKIPEVIDHAAEQTNNFIVVIEPGTPAGFQRIKQIRIQLLNLGFSLHAPCPHHEACTMEKGDWCHFSVRLPRTSLQRKLKGGSLGYEDEKFSYVVASKLPYEPSGARVLRVPIKRKGHRIVKLCTAGGVVEKVVTGKEQKKLKWGDLIDQASFDG